MNGAPTLSQYQQAAQAVYEPQKAAEAASLAATNKTTKNTLEAEKGQVSTNYQTALNNLSSSTTQAGAKINQQYEAATGGLGYFGNQTNDMTQLYSTAAQQQSTIEQTRANKLNDIAVAEGNADIQYNTGMSNLTPKYQSEEAQYANSNYGAALKQYDTEQYQNAELGMRQAELANTKNYQSAELALRAQQLNNSNASQYKVAGKSTTSGGTVVNGVAVGGTKNTSTNNGYNFTGPNGEPINMAQYISGKGGSGQDILNLLSNGSSYDKTVLQKVLKDKSGQTAIQNEDANGLVAAVKKYDKYNAYGF